MSSFERVLVGAEEADGCRDALRTAERIARVDGAKLHVAAVVSHELSAVGAEEYEVLREERFKRMLRVADEEIEGDYIPHRVVASSAAAGLSRVAEEFDASVIVIGSSHRGPLGRVLLGDVGSRLTAAAPCPVVVAPRGAKAPGGGAMRRIGVGFNGTAESEEALAAAADMARRWGGSLHLIGVMPEAAAPVPGSGGPDDEDNWSLLERDLTKRLTDAVERAGVEADWDLRAGDPAEQLAEASANLDLLAVGSRGYGPLKRVLLGGTAAKLLRCSHCPVIVMPRPAKEPKRHHEVFETLVPFTLL